MQRRLPHIFVVRGLAGSLLLLRGALALPAPAEDDSAEVDLARDVPARPNVILIVSDDLGYGDLAAHGNPVLQTPNLDGLYESSVRLTDFHVDPHGRPTRAALLTGRYAERTGVGSEHDGHGLMHPDEVTIAEILNRAGYRTGMFGKWHLGDNYPCRAQDQGFEESFYHGGGGIGQTPDGFGNDRFDDTYFRSGRREAARGYSTDVWFREAIEFVRRHREQMFFVLLAPNAPYPSNQVSIEATRPYREQGLPPSLAAFYGRIASLDQNLGRLLDAVKDLGLERTTLVVFVSDNGSAAGEAPARESASVNAAGFNAGMRGRKGALYEGGHRVPCFFRWPAAGIDGGRDVPQLAAHIDLLPTLVALCEVDCECDGVVDGRSLAALLKGDDSAWQERTLVVGSMRDKDLPLGRHSAVLSGRWRLVHGRELYDIRSDPGQRLDRARGQPDVVRRLQAACRSWQDLLWPNVDETVPILLGAERAPHVHLTCYDWIPDHGPVPWSQEMIRQGTVANGRWAVDVLREGMYELTLRRWPHEAPGPVEAVSARIVVGTIDRAQAVAPDESSAVFRVPLARGPTSLQTWLEMPDGRTRGAYFVDIYRLP